MQSRLAYRLLSLSYHHSLLSLFPPNIPRSLGTPYNYEDHFISGDWKQYYKSLHQYSSTLNQIFSHLRLSIQPFCQYYPPYSDLSLPAINFATPTQYSISKNDKPTATTEHLNFLQHNTDNIIVYTDGSKGQSLGFAFVSRISGAIYHENPSLKSAPTNWNRHPSRALLHFRTGHSFFASIRYTTVELSNQLCSCKSKDTRDHILLHCPRYHRARIKFFQALQLSPDDVTLSPAATITRTLLYPKPPKKSLYNRWDTRIKMLYTDKDVEDTNLKALKLVRRFIKDCGYLDRRCCPMNPFPC
jgi:hypothetical protein